jgi:ribonuclease BN (tRNA processing enzyme)
MSKEKLTLLGKSAAWPDAGQACSGILYQNEQTSILIDIGNGVLANLQKVIYPSQLDAVIITHFHSDHFFDLISLSHLLKYAPAPQGMPEQPVKLFVPPCGKNFLASFGQAANADNFADIFDICEYTSGQAFDCQGSWKAHPVNHFIECYAIEKPGKFVYGADSSADIKLPSAPLFILEATMPEPGNEGHMCLEEALDVAERFQTEKLIVVHYSEQYNKSSLYQLADKRPFKFELGEQMQIIDL